LIQDRNNHSNRIDRWFF